MSNNQIVFYDKVWNVNRNLALAITMADVASHSQNTRNGYISLVNVQNASNTDLRFTPFEVGETLYANDSNLTFTFTALDQIIYLDAPQLANGRYNNSGYGFQTGDIITQYCPQESVSVLLTEEEYLSLCGCSRCGCASTDCACEGGPTVINRTVTVVTAQERVITATVIFENNDPPYVCVKDASEKFCRYPITNGTITANVVGVTAHPATGNAYYGNYIIERPAIYNSPTYDAGNNLIPDQNIGLKLGPHIGIDRHFNRKRSQDYNNDFIIISNWDITGNNVPIGQVLDYWANSAQTYIAMGMNVNATAYAVGSNLLDVRVIGNSNANFVLSAEGALQLDANVFGSNNILKIANTNKNVLVINTSPAAITTKINVDSRFNTTLHTKSYAEDVTLAYGTGGILTINLSNSQTFMVRSDGTTISTLRLIKPSYDPLANAAYSATLVFDGSVNISNAAWTTANVHFPDGVKPNIAASRVISLLTTSVNDNIWYGFGATRTSGVANGTSYGFRWYKNTRPNDIVLTFSWNNPLGPADLNARVWLKAPVVEKSWEGPDDEFDPPINIVGSGYENSVFIGSGANPFSNTSMLYSSNSTGFSGAEIVTIPIDTVIASDPYFSRLENLITSYSNTYNYNNFSTEFIAPDVNGRDDMTIVIPTITDNTYATINLPFTVNVFNRAYSTVYVSDNIYLTFNLPPDIVYYPDPFETEINKDRIILNGWQPYDATKFLWLGTLEEGVAPNRTYRIRGEWNRASHNAVDNPNCVYEIVFYETPKNRIDIHLVESHIREEATEFQDQYIEFREGYDGSLAATEKYNYIETRYLYPYIELTANTTTPSSALSIVNEASKVVNPIIQRTLSPNSYIDIKVASYWNDVFPGEYNLQIKPPYGNTVFNFTLEALPVTITGSDIETFLSSFEDDVKTFRVYLRFLDIQEL